MVQLPKELLEVLPEEDELAFIVVEAYARDILDDLIRHTQENESTLEWEMTYMLTVLAAAREYEISALTDWTLPNSANEHQFKLMQQFRHAAGHVVVQLQLRNARRVKKFSVFIDIAGKEKLRHLLEKMRKIVDGLDLSVEKKERLYARIHDMQEEIDRDRTRLERLGALAIEVATLSSQVAQVGEPLLRLVERISVAIGLSQQTEQQKKIPAPADRKQIEPPKFDTSKKKSSFDQDLDDEIPF